jgi:hypothetical protein
MSVEPMSVEPMSVEPECDSWSVRAEHTGYRTRYAVVHRRTLTRTGPGRYLLSDVLVGRREARVGWSLLVSPDLQVHPTPSGWRVSDGDQPLVAIDVPDGWRRDLIRGRATPVSGWCSPRFGQLIPAYQLHLEGVLGDSRPLEVEITLMDRRGLRVR